MTGLYDSFQRPVNYLRISVTDRCNLRCVYCMPEDGVPLLRHSDILSYEEIYDIARAAAGLGINKVRLTGGEPLVRASLSRLVKMLASISTIDEISLTTNGTLLAESVAELKAAGLKRVNISLDTLQPERFQSITRRGTLADTLKGITAAQDAGLNPVKLNMVVMAGVNDDELNNFAAKTVTDGWHVRFIEVMPFAGKPPAESGFFPVSAMKQRIESLGKLEPVLHTAGNGPAKYYRLPDATGTIGFITPVSEHFCYQCNRLRLTADGKLRPCLMSDREIDLKDALRRNVPAEDLQDLIRQAVAAKPRAHHLAEGCVPQGRFFSQIGG
ncbi:MAG: GTP 3',8-cyclase MoaA [Dehalococcoidales bacterium]|nr:GTP 3',8-cyclase MoaA [Dehalococcoidales bacterium]